MVNSAKANPKDPTPFISLSIRETTGWSVALFLLFGWLFFLGVLVGRGSIEVNLIPTEVARELAVIPDKQAVPTLEKEAQALPATPPPVELSFYKEVKQSEEAITKSSRMTKAETPVLTPRVAATLPSAPAAPAAAQPPAPLATRPAPQAAIPPPTAGFTSQVSLQVRVWPVTTGSAVVIPDVEPAT